MQICSKEHMDFFLEESAGAGVGGGRTFLPVPGVIRGRVPSQQSISRASTSYA